MNKCVLFLLFCEFLFCFVRYFYFTYFVLHFHLFIILCSAHFLFCFIIFVNVTYFVLCFHLFIILLLHIFVLFCVVCFILHVWFQMILNFILNVRANQIISHDFCVKTFCTHMHAHVRLFIYFCHIWCSDTLSLSSTVKSFSVTSLSLSLKSEHFSLWNPLHQSSSVSQSHSFFSLLFWAVFTFPDSSVPHHQLSEVTAHILGLQRGLAHWKRAAKHTHTHNLNPPCTPMLSFSIALAVTHIHLHPHRPLCPSINS